MKKVMVFVAMIVMTTAGIASAQSKVQPDPPARAGYIWVKDQTAAGGHWKRARAGAEPSTEIDKTPVNIPPTRKPPGTVSPRTRPDVAESEIGYSTLMTDAPGAGSSVVTYMAGISGDLEEAGIKVIGDNIDINRLQPQHRSIGETSVLTRPKQSYEILEGIVLHDNRCQVSYEDFPTTHYTHDFTFHVLPDKEFEHLLARKGSDNFQKNIEVEWESGLGADGGSNNPAAQSNIKGNSFGFYSKGHKRKDVIWNWAVPNDRVHVEGIWIWERGHLPSHTEIHPPHFIAIERSLPVSFNVVGNSAQINNLPTDQFYGTRIDIFADADGSTMWNKKGLKPFAQTVDMSRKDYTFTVGNLFTKPQNSQAQLAFKIIKRPGDDFPVDPIVTLLPNGDAQITVPWKSNNVSDFQTFARTIVLYWNVPATQGILLPGEKPTLHKIQLDKLKVLDDDDNNSTDGVPVAEQVREVFTGNDDGEWFMYANVGSDWYMLNEFTTNETNALSGGIHDAKEGQEYAIKINCNVYVSPLGSYRVFANGWEGDHINTRMGIIHDEYDRSVNNAKPFLKEIFSTEGLLNGKILDDDLGEMSSVYGAFSPLGANSKNSNSGNYKLFWSVQKINN
ncbi:MAG: hypothetical protein U0264_05620 [Candidatus Kapaibacterium sp.]